MDNIHGGTHFQLMATYLAALLFGVVAGLRALTAPAVVSWAVHVGWLDLAGSRLAFLGHGWVRWSLTVLALAELVTDQLPATPSRRVPVQFTARLFMGALSGAAVGASARQPLGGALAGVIGAAIGTVAGSRARTRLAGALHNDHPAAIIEDAVAIGGAVLTGFAVR
jgi:uncharacterized membrane protein